MSFNSFNDDFKQSKSSNTIKDLEEKLEKIQNALKPFLNISTGDTFSTAIPDNTTVNIKSNELKFDVKHLDDLQNSSGIVFASPNFNYVLSFDALTFKTFRDLKAVYNEVFKDKET